MDGQPGATEQLANFAVAFEYHDISDLAQERGKRLLVDYFGVLLAAVDTEMAHAALATLAAHPELAATLAGTRMRGSAGEAAFYHGALAHGLEFDDSTLSPVGHPSTVILPALLALAEQISTSGKDVLRAYHVGLEVHARLGTAQKGNWSFSGGWLPIGHISLIGAAAACANLLRLNSGQVANAIALGTQFCGQLAVNSASHAKPFGAGNSARCALMAAILAQQGMQGVAGVIERPGGFADTFFGEGSHDLEAALAKLGDPLHIEEVGIAIKRYPSCYGAHWGNDALIDIMRENNLSAHDIRAIELAHPQSGAFLDEPDPRNSEEAKFSHQYNLAVTALDGMPGVDSFSERRCMEADVREFLGKVSTRVHDAGLEAPAAWEYRVTVETGDGRRLKHAVPRPLGHPRRPMSDADLERKFRDCVAKAMTPSDADELIGILLGLDELADLAPLARLIGGKRASRAQAAAA